LTDSSQCGDWQQYEGQKCVKIIDADKTLSFDDAVKACLQADNGSYLLTIHSKEEQDFISEFLFKTNKIVENVWLGLKKDNNFKWSDGSNLDFANWLTGNPSNKSDHNCVQMLPESSPIGKWSDIPCIKKNIAVCQKIPTISLTILHKILLETRQKSEENILKFNKFLNNLANDKWMKFELFSNTDEKLKAFFIPSKEYERRKSWDQAVNLCYSFNATLVEMDSSNKEFLFLSYLGELGLQSNRLDYIWLNGYKDSSGKWKWINSGKEMTYNNWYSGFPKNGSGYDYLLMSIYEDGNFGKILNDFKISTHHVFCEIYVNF
jgi:hypothetical protein